MKTFEIISNIFATMTDKDYAQYMRDSDEFEYSLDARVRYNAFRRLTRLLARYDLTIEDFWTYENA